MAARRPAPRPALRRVAAWIALVSVASLATGCAGSGRPREQSGAVPSDHPRVALLPFDNLSGREEQERLFTQTFLATLVGTQSCEVVDLGRAEALLERLRIRATGSLTPEQMSAVGESLKVSYVMLGSVLESGRVRTADGETPTVGASLRLVDAATGRIAWANVRVLTGDERETVFGWGRELSAERLLTKLADEMLRDFRRVGDDRRKRATKGETSR
jgi:TolB-like protein